MCVKFAQRVKISPIRRLNILKYSFNGFTEKANEALNQAISSACRMGHTYVGSEHLLLGLLKIGSGVAASVLNRFDITSEKIEELISINIGAGTPTKLSPDYFTPRAKNVIEVAMRTSANMGKKYIGTEHILIGILSEKDNFAIRFFGIFVISSKDAAHFLCNQS